MSSEYRTEMESGDYRCAKCSLVVLKELTRIMQELLKKSNTHATHIYTIIMNDALFKRDYLNEDQIEMVEKLNTYGYDIIDISLAYKIVKYYNTFIPQPSRGWGQEPYSKQISISDDVERIRILRNRFVHLANTNISVESFNDFFKTCIEVGKRVDDYLEIPCDQGYEHAIRCYQGFPLDSVLKRKYLDALNDIEKLKETLQCEIEKGGLIVHVLIGRSMEQAFKMMKQSEGKGKIGLEIIFHGIDDGEHYISLINSLKETLDTNNIKISIAKKGCIIVSIDVEKKVIVDEWMFESEICTFIRKLFKSCKLTSLAQETAYAVITPSECDFDSKSRISTPEANIEVDQTGEKFSTTLEGFFNDLAGNRNENNIVGKDDMDDVLVPLATVDVEYGSQSSTLETKSDVNETQEKIGTTLEGFIKDLAGKGNEHNMVGKDDIDASTVCTKGNMSNVVGERNLIDKISTELTTMTGLLIDKAAKGMEIIKENNDIIDEFLHRGTGESVIYSRVEGNRSTVFGETKSFVDAISKLDRPQEKIRTTFEGSFKDQPAKGIKKNIGKSKIKDTSFVIPYATGLKRKFDE